MFTDDFGKFSKNSGIARLSTEICSYQKPPYGLTRYTDDIATYRGNRNQYSLWPVVGVLISIVVIVSFIAICL